MPLTSKQARFVDEYMVDMNATQAAIRAGYSAKTAGDIGRQLLRKTPVAVAIAERQRVLSERSGITAERVIDELAKIGFSDIRKLVKWRSNATVVGEDPDTGAEQMRAFNEVEIVDSSQIDDRTAAAISEVSQSKEGTLRVKLYDKQAALVSLGKHLGLFKEKVEVTGKDGGPIEVEEVSARELVEGRIARLAARKGQGEGS